MDKHKMRNRLNEVIKTDATIVEPQDFMATHVPFKKLNYYNSGLEDRNGKKLDEEEFYLEFIKNIENKHGFIVVQGDNGAGKSHFIRWMENKIESEEMFPNDITILIERSQNTLQGTIKQLINNPEIEKLISEEEKLKLKNTGIELSEEKFISMINYNCIIEIENEEEDDDECILNNRERKMLIEFLKDTIVQERVLFKNNGPIKRISNKLINNKENSISEEDIRFKAKDFEIAIELAMEITQNEGNRNAERFAEKLFDNRRDLREKVAKYLNGKIETVIQRTIKLNGADLNLILEEIRQKLKDMGKNLVLLIEDITAFTGIDKGLVEALIVEDTKENGLCRLISIVGVTSGYYNNSFPSNLKDRITGRIVIQSESLFDNYVDVLDLAARYINAIKCDKKELEEWIVKGARDNELPIKKAEKNWFEYEDEKGRLFDLYPLTKQAIVNLYRVIGEERTPRRFIKNILLPMLENYTKSKLFPIMEDLEATVTIPKFESKLIDRKINEEIEDLKERDRTKCLLRIWGDGTLDLYKENGANYIGKIREEIFDEFKITKVVGNEIKKQKEENTKKLSIKNNIVNETIIKIENIPEKKKDIEENQVENIPKKSGNDKNKEGYENLEKEITAWFEEDKLLRNHIKIRDEIISVLKEGINWTLEEVKHNTVDNVLVRNNLKIENQQGEHFREDNIIFIERTEENYYFILSLMKYSIIGNKKWDYENSQDDIIVITQWLEKNKEKIKNYIINGNDINYDRYLYALLAEIYNKKINMDIDINKYKNVAEIMSNIFRNIEVKSESSLTKIVGEYDKSYKNKESLMIDNNKFIKEFYNCSLGKGKSVNFIDAIEVLRRLNKLRKVEFNIGNLEKLNFKLAKEYWKLPYESLFKVYNSEFEKAIKEKIQKLNKMKEIQIESFEEVGSINELFEVFDEYRIHFNADNKRDFKESFDDSVKFVEYRENIEKLNEVESSDILEQIDFLRSDRPIKIEKSSKVLEEINRLIDKQYELYNSKTKNMVEEIEIENVSMECRKKIEEIEKKINS